MERWGFGHSPRPLTGTTGPNRPVVTYPKLFKPLGASLAGFPLLPGQLTHPSAQMFVKFGHVPSSVSQRIVVHPSRDGSPQAVTDFRPASVLRAAG